MYVARQTTGRSLPFIASKMGMKDHSTILHGVRTIAALIDAGDAGTIAAVNAIAAQLTGGVHV
jgi:chromosomal replication initiation ATPase DnaA